MTSKKRNREGLTWEEWSAATGRAVLSHPEHDAWLAGEDPTEWKVPPPERGPIRWVITHFSVKSGYRTLLEPGQGRYTYATKEEAEEKMCILEPSLREKILGDAASSLAVMPVECWPGHHDPKKKVFSAIDLITAIFWEPERQFEEFLREAAKEIGVPVEYLNPPGSSFASAQGAQMIREDIFKKAVEAAQWVEASCTCDAIGDGPCPQHGAAMAAQDVRTAAENEKEKP